MRKILFFLFILCSIAAKSQVVAPEIKCVQNDTVKWNLPNNTCGVFFSYLVYGSKNQKGPYILLEAVTNQAQKTFYHKHPQGENWYYFLQTKANCPGLPVLSSDTLTSASPELPTLQSVSIEKGAVEIKWEPSISKNIASYIIYKQTPTGTKPIDTIFSGTTFIDKNVQPDKNRETYYVISQDKCGNTSLFEKSHTTIQSNTTQDECERSVLLSWNKYKAWKGGTLNHEIWIKEGNGNFALIATAPEKDSVFRYKNLKDNTKYCFYVKSTQKENPIYFSKTNETCITSDVVQPTDFILVKNLNINAKGEASFTWIWNNDADLDSIKIKKSIEGSDFKDIASLPTKALAGEISFTDKNSEIGSKTVYYGIYALDKCDNYVFAPFNTLNITGKIASSGVNNLTWTDHYVQGVDKIEYELYRIVNGIESQAWATTNENEFNDKFDLSNDDNAKICYYVVAYAWDTLPNGKAVKVRSRSNTVCVEQTSGVFIPNAFAPRGENQEFRPLISFSAQIKNYSMLIFDRYGAKIFESKNFDTGWNGKLNGSGKDMEQAIYTYYISVTQTNDKTTESKGTVFLAR